MLHTPPDNLIELWLAVETCCPGRRAADALRDLNEELSTAYTASHLSRWRRGVSQPSSLAQAHMREGVIEEALRYALHLSPLLYDNEQLDHLAALLSPPSSASR